MQPCNQENKLPKMMTIRQVAKTKILPEHALRLMLKQGTLPHIKIGVKILVNFDLLLEQLNSLKGSEIKND